MGRTTGSDSLFRLIHSLTKEEKGYFVKFVKRHVPDGGVALQLFNAISQQTEFEEKQLIKKFRHYAKMKVYVKDMITDSLLLYFRNHHPHVLLLNQIQKVHVLLIKGMQHEALKVLDKALEQAETMELFNIERYLLRMRFDLGKHQLESHQERRLVLEKYTHRVAKLIETEGNLFELESISEDLFLRFIEADKDFGQVKYHLEKEIKALTSQKGSSLRAEGKRKSALTWLYFLQGDIPLARKMCEDQLRIENELKNHHDSSVNIVPITTNNITNYMDSHQPELVEKMCRQMIASEVKDKFYYDYAFTRGILLMAEAFYYMGDFEKALDELEKNETAVLEGFVRLGDKRKLRRFYYVKLILLFVNRKFMECWICLNETTGLIKKVDSNIPDLLVLEMMTQLELDNFSLLHRMAAGAERKMRQKAIGSPDHFSLTNFFKNVSPDNIKEQAAKTLREIKFNHARNKSNPIPAFGILPFEYWLETKCSDKTLAELVTAPLKTKG